MLHMPKWLPEVAGKSLPLLPLPLLLLLLLLMVMVLLLTVLLLSSPSMHPCARI
jgi:hypothetical protein